ncbi:unnamed protein product [Calypogeia fissa]
MDSVIRLAALPVLGLASLVWHLSTRSGSKPAWDDEETSTKTPSPSETSGKKTARQTARQLAIEAHKEKKGAEKKDDGLPITDPNWQWSVYDQYVDKEGRVKLTKREEGKGEEAESGPFRVIYQVQKDQQWPDVVQITLYSRSLCKLLEQYLPNNGDLKTLAEPTIAGRELWIVLDQLKNHIFNKDGSGKPELDHELANNGNGAIDYNGQLANGNGLKTNDLTNGDADHIVEETTIQDDGKAAEGKELELEEEAELHLKHLIRFMDKEYRDAPVRVRRMLQERKAPWDMLWAFLPSGKKVVYTCDHSEELLYAVVSSNYFQVTMEGWVFMLELDVYGFDGRNYKKCQVSRRIRKYEGERSFAGLAVCPVELIGTPEMLEERFLENGRKYFELAIKHKHLFMHYTGPLFEQKLSGQCYQLHKENADGRVMIDLESFAKMKPDYPMGNAKPPTMSKYSMVRRSNGAYVFRVCTPGDCYDGPSNSSSSAAMESVSEDNLIYAPGIVYGFSFTLKMWGSFAISGFRDISFDSSAFQQLVMEPQMKGLVHNLVSHYIGTPAEGSQQIQRVDPISNKGNGCVFLCYGPPGTGKTLTAESIAETMRRPLWSLSVSELGTTPKELEQTLFKVLDIAAAWKAVILLDEADVYLEKRVSGADLTRNAMTGVFLRMLEYYKGVLFLTTNRIGTFDEAFRSRISMFLHYSTLSVPHKEQIWKALLGKAQVQDFSHEKLSELAALDLNGREIRNAIHTAQSLSQSNGERLEFRHVEYVISVLASSLKSLNEALHAPAYN